MEFGAPDFAARSLSEMARGLVGPRILRIGAEIRARIAAGEVLCNLTVGDFDPTQFPIPAPLRDGIMLALAAGETNYPPSDGLLALREAVSGFYRRALGLDYPVESVVVASGARPLIYAVYRTLLDPGDVVVYPVPSWNNHDYVHLMGARGIALPVSAATNFFPRAEDYAAHLGEARLLVINSPANPTGAMIAPEVLRAIARAVVAENERRRAAGKKALWLCYDQVYWQLTYGAHHHVTPPELAPEVAPYTILVDAASKGFAATGLRVGWALMPPGIRASLADVVGHMGAWAPRPEQIAMSRWLREDGPLMAYRQDLCAGLKARLDLLANGFRAMKAEGLPVDVLEPQGAIYLSAAVTKPGLDGETIRKHLLDHARVAVVPFEAFNLPDAKGWFRLSVGAVSVKEITEALPRLRAAITAL